MTWFEHKFCGFSRTTRSVAGLSHSCWLLRQLPCGSFGTSDKLTKRKWNPTLSWSESLELGRSQARSASLDVLHSSALLLSHHIAQWEEETSVWCNASAPGSLPSCGRFQTAYGKWSAVQQQLLTAHGMDLGTYSKSKKKAIFLI